MNLDELRIILLSERETGRLVHIPPDLFASAHRSLNDLYKELHACSDPFSDEAQVLIQRIHAMRETLSDLFHIRAEKILSLARTQEDGHYIDRDELKRLLPEEREMYDLIVQALGQARCRLLAETTHQPAGRPGAGSWRRLPTSPRCPHLPAETNHAPRQPVRKMQRGPLPLSSPGSCRTSSRSWAWTAGFMTSAARIS